MTRRHANSRHTILLALAGTALGPWMAVAQEPSGPLPEFFGLYARIGTELVELVPNPNGPTFSSGIGGADLLRSVSDIVLDTGDVEFILHTQSPIPSQFAAHRVARVPFQATQQGWSARQVSGNDALRPVGQWYVTDQGVGLRVGPVPGGSQNMVQIVPRGRLPAGIYAIPWQGELYDFKVGPDPDTAADCLVRVVAFVSVSYQTCPDEVRRLAAAPPRTDSSVSDVPAESPRPRFAMESRRAIDDQLRRAATYGRSREVRQLLDRGADPNAATSPRRIEGIETPLLGAVRGGHDDMVRLLVERGADPNLKAPGRTQFTPLHQAAVEGRLSVVKALLEVGAEVDSLNGLGFSPLRLAVMFDRRDAARVLREAGAANAGGATRAIADDDLDTPGADSTPGVGFAIPAAGAPTCAFDEENCRSGLPCHTGVDLPALPDGQARAVAPGTVVLVQRNGDNDHGLGNVVILAHTLTDGDEIFSLYGHLAQVPAGLNGLCVPQGTVLGRIGGTGYGNAEEYAIHLHFELKTAATLGNPSGAGSYWGHTPEPAEQYGFLAPDEFFDGEARALACE